MNVEMVIRTIQKNTQLTQETIRNLAAHFSGEQSCNCEHALANAFLSNVEHAAEETKQRLGILIEKYRRK